MTEVKQGAKRRWIWSLGAVALFAVVLFGDVWVSKLVFYRLCATEGGEDIRQVIDGVEGIVVDYGENVGCDPRCKELLGTYRYRFVEMHVDSPNPQFFTSTAGTYKFYLTNRDQVECAAYEGALKGKETSQGTRDKRFGIPGSMCVAALPIGDPASNYAYQSVWQYGYVKALRISKLESTITERSSGLVVGRRVAFARLRASGWLGRLLSGVDPGNETCHLGDEPLLVKVLKPGA